MGKFVFSELNLGISSQITVGLLTGVHIIDPVQTRAGDKTLSIRCPGIKMRWQQYDATIAVKKALV